MKILFDARCIDTSLSRPSIYIRELLARMPSLSPDSSWHVIFSDEKVRDRIMGDERIAGARGITSEIIPYPFSSLSGNFRLFGYRITRHFDIYFSPVAANSFLAFGGAGGISRASVVTVHTLPGLDTRSSFVSAVRRWSLKRVVRNCDAMIAVSRTLRDDIVKMLSLSRGAAGKIHKIYNGVSEIYSPCDCERRDAFAGAVVYVGNHRSHKNIPTLIRAFAELRRKSGRELHLLLGGSDGAMSERERLLVRDLGISGHVSFLGEVSEKDLRDIYREAALVVSPSSYEGFPSALLEAMQSGTPIVCCDGGAQREFAWGVTDPVPPRDMQSLCSAMSKMILDDTQRSECIKAGIARANKFTWDDTASETLDVFRRVLALKKGDGI